MSRDNAIWPNDIVIDPSELYRETPHKLVCFMLSPFEPRGIFDDVHKAVELACGLCRESAGVEIECRRSDTLHEAKAIHDDIWRHISAADLLVVDVTGLNPNVMLEFGVAAALRRPQHVILIKSADDPSPLPFNVFAQRYLKYGRSILGDGVFLQLLKLAMIEVITPAPYRPASLTGVQPTSFKIDFKDGDRPDLALSPGIIHRRKLDDCLEVGSLWVFRNSWLLLTASSYRDVRARVKFYFSELREAPAASFLGISLRNNHFLANWGHMVLIRADGLVMRTQPKNELGAYEDITIKHIPNYDYQAHQLVELSAEFNSDSLVFDAAGIGGTISVKDMPYVYAAGNVRIVIGGCRVCIREIELQGLD